MDMKQAIEKIAKLKEDDIGSTEENVKQKVIVPILEALNHKKENLSFEYGTKNGRIDIFIKKNVPPDCKVVIDTKNYNENLNDHIAQIRDYTFSENALLAVIANGKEIRIYSPLRGVPFERSLLYSIKIQDIIKETEWKILSDLLQYDNLQNRNVHKIIERREREIKDAMSNEDLIKHEYEDKIEDVDSGIEEKEDEIEQLKKEKEDLEKEVKSKIAEIWKAINLPIDFVEIRPPPGGGGEGGSKVPNVRLQELVDAGLLRNGQVLTFFHGRLFNDEQAEVLANKNKLRYKKDGIEYSISRLAANIDIKLGLKHDDYLVAGPRYWKTENGKLLHDLNDIVRNSATSRRRNIDMATITVNEKGNLPDVEVPHFISKTEKKETLGTGIINDETGDESPKSYRVEIDRTR